ncbi:MAG: HTH domain-containing protein [Emcibacteraceae bacterium]|nr:HTH domain-containing protein [Emcibacteraceae bacterium]
MRRSDRLFQIIQILRSASKKPITAQQLAEELETSPRTIYRDIAELLSQRIPIRGEAGIGYILESGYDMPPLMLTESEVEAALLGAQYVANLGDPDLARGARDLISKIGDVIPDAMQTIVLEPVSMAAKLHGLEIDRIDMQQLRNSIRHRLKLKITYEDAKK